MNSVDGSAKALRKRVWDPPQRFQKITVMSSIFATLITLQPFARRLRGLPAA